jgi:hypothetical protein
MTYSFDGFNYLIRLNKGEQLMASLQKFAQDSGIEGAWVNGLGGATAATLGFYDLDNKEYRWQEFDGLCEVVSLTGNLAFDEQRKLIVHLHGVLADEKYQTVGGHVKDLTVAATLELFVHRAYQPTKRKFDETAGLALLDLG